MLCESPAVAAPTREAALNRTLNLLGRVPEQSRKWLLAIFRERPDFGMYLIQVTMRLDAPELEDRVADAVASVAKENPTRWVPVLRLLAVHWTSQSEAALLSFYEMKRLRDILTSGNPSPSPEDLRIRAKYGRTYEHQFQVEARIEELKRQFARLITTVPMGERRASLDPNGSLRIMMATAEMKCQSEDFPGTLVDVELMATTRPEDASSLANELILNWSRAHSGATILRATQGRYLKELGEMLSRLRNTHGVTLSDATLAEAFVSAHSPSEVFRQPDVELVFGPLEKIRASGFEPLAPGHAHTDRLDRLAAVDSADVSIQPG